MIVSLLVCLTRLHFGIYAVFALFASSFTKKDMVYVFFEGMHLQKAVIFCYISLINQCYIHLHIFILQLQNHQPSSSRVSTYFYIGHINNFAATKNIITIDLDWRENVVLTLTYLGCIAQFLEIFHAQQIFCQKLTFIASHPNGGG